MKKLFGLLIVFSLGMGQLVKADEGMWLPLFIERLNYVDMEKMGLHLTPDEIYSVNHSSLKDAIIIFGGGCTGEIVSPEGLIFTNHHCGYSSIQKHSTIEHDYLTEGFWAMSKKEELPNEGLTAKFLVRIEDVTQQILPELTDDMTESEREKKAGKIGKKISDEAVKDTRYDAYVKSFFAGNEYYLFVYEVYKDIRLVGAPPSSIGKFGADTDNWMWPRHTGDFSIFRVYTAPDGSPAEYAEENIPLKSKYYLPVSTGGVKKGDFAMIMGYPGGTERYLSSWGVEMAIDQTNPTIVSIRDKKLEIINAAQNADPKVRIQYASKAAGISNSWKRWKGEIRGLDKLDAIAKKQTFEKKFNAWAAEDPQRMKKYGSLLDEYAKIYPDYGRYRMLSSVISEVFYRYGIEAAGLARSFFVLEGMINDNAPQEKVQAQVETLKKRTQAFFRDYDVQVDRQLFLALLEIYEKDMPKEYWPASLVKWQGKEEKYMEWFYKKTLFADSVRMQQFLDDFSAASLKKLQKDPA